MIFIFTLGVYSSLLTGWSSNSKYSLIGRMRRIAQSISYEIILGFRLFSLSISTACLSLHMLVKFNHPSSIPLGVGFNIIFLLIFVTFLIELNRTPFDLVECESELVSGFNVEYGGVEFRLIFLGENLIIIVCSILLVYLFFFHYFLSLQVIITILFIILIRGRLPRVRFDKIINTC